MADFMQAIRLSSNGGKTHRGRGFYMVFEEGKIVFRSKDTGGLWLSQEIDSYDIDSDCWETYTDKSYIKCPHCNEEIKINKGD